MSECVTREEEKEKGKKLDKKRATPDNVQTLFKKYLREMDRQLMGKREKLLDME